MNQEHLQLRASRPGDAPFLFRWRGDADRLREWNSARFCPSYETFVGQLSALADLGRIYILESRLPVPVGIVQFDRLNPIANSLFASLLVVPDQEDAATLDLAVGLTAKKAKEELGIGRTIWELFETDQVLHDALVFRGAQEIAYVAQSFWFNGTYVGRRRLSLQQ